MSGDTKASGQLSGRGFRVLVPVTHALALHCGEPALSIHGAIASHRNPQLIRTSIGWPSGKGVPWEVFKN